MHALEPHPKPFRGEPVLSVISANEITKTSVSSSRKKKKSAMYRLPEASTR